MAQKTATFRINDDQIRLLERVAKITRWSKSLLIRDGIDRMRPEWMKLITDHEMREQSGK